MSLAATDRALAQAIQKLLRFGLRRGYIRCVKRGPKPTYEMTPAGSAATPEQWQPRKYTRRKR